MPLLGGNVSPDLVPDGPRSAPEIDGGKWRWVLLAALPVLSAGLPIASLFVAPLRSTSVHTAELAAVEIVAAFGCALAATSFEWSDHLAPAWCLQGLLYALLVIRGVALSAGLLTGSDAAILNDGILTTLANLSGVAATWMLARTGHLAGIDVVIPAGSRAAIWLIALVFAASAAGQGTVGAFRDLWNGNAGALVSVSSRVGDVVAFVLIAPILLTTLALRQGLLVWPWAFLTCSGLCWLSADSANASFVHLPNDKLGPFFDIFRVPACFFVFSAGVAQRLVVRAQRWPRVAPTHVG
jgi:hypothetical protein